ncbi:MAG: insulinase family protein [Bacteroidales bacterium]|nr:insulinase family protein [Bacteroidales bacterium]
MKTNRMYLFLVAWLIALGTLSAQGKFTYESFEGDPLNARIYTLDNGLKVYLSVYDEEPRIQTYVAVRVGSKHDPAETTGLAHYFEHLMFKGTSTFGTIDWAKEEPLLDEIEALFERYRLETDEDKRATLYHKIDSISYLASTYAIANEYDRLMTAIGSIGTNAATSNDFTFYVENIPSNRLEQWARIQSERFSDPVLRLFHTELETVYEELNMSLTNDARKVSAALYRGLFPEHPYGLQTTLGEPEHLKNPSIINIKNFFNEYYVPNNMAVVMAGDFDPDEAIVLIDKYFGQLEPSPLPDLRFGPQPELTEPVVKEVVGLQAENIQLGWRFDGAGSDHVPYLNMIRMILFNGRAGLIDQNLNKQMATLGSNAGLRSMVDYSVFTLSGRNKSGQTLDEVKDLLLEQLALLKNGDFPDWLMEAAINNLRLQEMRRAENIRSRAMMMAMSFLNGVPYEESIQYLDQLGAISKEDLVAFANKHLREDNYVVVYKRQGQPLDVEQVEKPPITPIHINRDDESALLQEIKATEVEPIEPVFLDYTQDIARGRTQNGIEVLYAHNDANPTFTLTYFWRMGSHHDRYLPLAGGLLQLLGTEEHSAEDIANEFYKLACTYTMSVGAEETRITISGLSENLEEAIKLFEYLAANAKIEDAAFQRYITNIKNSRHNSKADQRTNFMVLVNYAMYGPDNPSTFVLTDEAMDALSAERLLTSLQDLWRIEHQIVFFGPQSLDELSDLAYRYHKTPETLAQISGGVRFQPRETLENKVYFAHYDANQSYLQTISKGISYNPDILPRVTMYNQYFGGGMNAIVFQEMREKRGLAYTARASYSAPGNRDDFFMNTSFIATQNDKVADAFNAFNDLFDDIPLSETTFRLAQDQIISNIRTQRIRNAGVIWNYLNAKHMGRDYDLRQRVYEDIPGMTLDDIIDFNRKYVQNQPKTFVILGNENVVDFEEVEKLFGPVTRLTQEDLFVF